MGGMGEVYRARDTKLHRDVALKVLPESFTHDPERVARFRREAQVLASINHPHIGGIYGLEDANSVTALVLELVEGPTLADRIAHGPIPLDEALPVAKQIAEALEAAHEQGIIHRDLKPANIKVRRDGTVKVLDFGLAKALDPLASSPDVSQSPTITTPAMTQAGMILGTAAYMSPEQAKGRPADKRSDIWAFGAVLYEMLTGTAPFAGETISDTLAGVLERSPDWSRLPPALPASARRLLQRCLEKDRNRRLADISTALFVLDRPMSEEPPGLSSGVVRTARTRERLVMVAVSVLLAVATGAAVWWLRPSPAPPQPVRFTLTPSAGALVLPTGTGGSTPSPFRDAIISPDGKYLIYNIGTGATNAELWVRGVDQLEPVRLTGATGIAVSSPFMSPDSKWIGFFADSQLKKVSITGGPSIPVCSVPGTADGFWGGAWAPDDSIIFASDDPATGLLSVPAEGGEPKVLTKPDREHGERDHALPTMLPNGRAVLFTIIMASVGGSLDSSTIAALDLKTHQQKVLIRGGTAPEYVDGGYIVYASAGSVRAVRFDPEKLQVLSDPVPVIDSVVTKRTGAADLSISRNGTLVYVPGDGQTAAAQRTMVWVSRDGREEPIKAPPRAYLAPRISSDGTRVALYITDEEIDIWIFDLARKTLKRLTSDPTMDGYPTWTPDGRRIIFSSARSGQGAPATLSGQVSLFWQAADGTGAVEPLPQGVSNPVITSITPDGLLAVGQAGGSVTTSNELILLHLGDKPWIEPLIPPSKFTIRNADLSRDAKWLAYDSNESGQPQTYVRPFPNVDGGSWQVSTRGGTRPLWARNGRELFYIDGDNYLTSVPVKTGTTFTSGEPVRILQARYFTSVARTYDASLDGQKFLMIKDAQRGTPPPSMVVVLNWKEELKQRVPTR
jgi:serine/threonine protein kinase/Tol biopolymer transport system component